MTRINIPHHATILKGVRIKGFILQAKVTSPTSSGISQPGRSPQKQLLPRETSHPYDVALRKSRRDTEVGSIRKVFNINHRLAITPLKVLTCKSITSQLSGKLLRNIYNFG
jgi:hypothetical protein